MSQKWPLYQSANKSSGTCSICLADGTIHKHGPRHSPCTGSNKPPLQAASVNSPAIVSQSADISTTSTAAASDWPKHSWSPPPTALIKHIPKSVRSACASHLASVLRKVVANSQSADNWLEVFNWGHSILHQPKRGRRRHNLSSVIKRRLSAYTADGGTPSVSETSQQHRQSTGTLSQAVSAKLEGGDVSEGAE